MESTKDVCGEAEGRLEREQKRYLQGRLQVASKSLAICRVSVSRNVSLFRSEIFLAFKQLHCFSEGILKLSKLRVMNFLLFASISRAFGSSLGQEAFATGRAIGLGGIAFEFFKTIHTNFTDNLRYFST